MFIYICSSKRDDLTMQPFGSMFLERDERFMPLLLFIHFVSASIWNYNAHFMYYI